MNSDELNKRINQINIENFIWIIYIVIIFMSWYSNFLEKKYFIYNDLNSKEKYRKIIIGIFVVLVVIYFYSFKSSYNDLKNLNLCDSNKKKNLTFIAMIASLLILISGILYLYIAISDEDINVEIAFN